jgi:hypothetical protein
VLHQIMDSLSSCASGSICFELIKGFPAAIIALIVAYIAFRQYSVSKAKLKLALFEKRYPIFLETWTILSEVAREGTRTKSYGLGNPFSNFIPQATFLFGKDVDKYLSNAVKKWTELWAIEGEAQGQGVNRQENIAKRSELEKWFFDEASVGAKRLFGRYLYFDRWK